MPEAEALAAEGEDAVEEEAAEEADGDEEAPRL